ncbi:acyl-ACP thioesterase domain-containing protein [Streptococcus sp. zg-JUN1979]|uniref:acyl-ACP thioesterase domain-containing protein n=1 Tax=Streptococcus sp. zg-JUN1979 TaxID=3391450 RepID=UPI0039A77404
MGLRYQESYEVPFYETDVNHHMKLPQLLSLALQVSGHQSYQLGISDEVIFERYGLVWVITDYHIDIERLPYYGETITIETDPVSYNRLFCYRYFYIYDENHTKIMTIFATFVLMDFNTRKVHPVVEDIVKSYESDKIKKAIRGPRYSALELAEETLYHLRYFDLDMNGHVNNSKYIEWMFEVLDLDFLTRYIPKTLDLKYVKEIHYGQDIVSSVKKEDLTTRHEIVIGDTVHAQAIIHWQDKKETR